MADAEVLTLQGVADVLQVSVFTVRRLVTRGTIRGFHVGQQWRVRRSALDTFIDNQATVTRQQRGEPAITPSVRHLKGWDTFL